MVLDDVPGMIGRCRARAAYPGRISLAGMAPGRAKSFPERYRAKLWIHLRMFRPQSQIIIDNNGFPNGGGVTISAALLVLGQGDVQAR